MTDLAINPAASRIPVELRPRWATRTVTAAHLSPLTGAMLAKAGTGDQRADGLTDITGWWWPSPDEWAFEPDRGRWDVPVGPGSGSRALPVPPTLIHFPTGTTEPAS